MSNFITKFKYLWTSPEDLDALIEVEQMRRAQREWEAQKDKLQLCVRHQQKSGHYAEHNCDHCKLLKILASKGDNHG